MSLRLRAALLVAITLVLAMVGTRIQLTTELTAALPKEGDVARAFDDVNRFALLDTVFFTVDGTGATPEALGAALDQLGGALEATGDFASVRYRYSLADGLALRTAATPHLAVLTPPSVLADRLSPEGLARTFDRARNQLLGPAGAVVARTLPGDPLDLGGRFTASMSQMGAATGTELVDGHLLSADHAHGLIIARPNTPALGTSLDSPLVTHVQAALANAPLPADWVGPHRFAAEAALQIHTEVQRAVTADLVLMCLVFLLAFRSLRPLAGTIPALLVAGAGAAAMAAVRSPIHAIGLAFGGALAGMGVDYWIHLYLTGVRGGVAGTFRERLHQGEEALKELWPAYRVSIAATVGSFAMMATSSYQSVSDLGFIGIGTASGALASVVLGGPLVFAALARPKDRIPWLPVPTRVPGWVASGLTVVFLGLAAVATGVRFEGDPRAMDARLPETAKLDAEFQQRFGGDATIGLLVAEGPDLDTALTRLATGVKVLDGCSGLSVRSPLPLLPTAADRAAAAALAASPDLEARVVSAADAAGFEGSGLVPGLRATLAATTPPTVADWDGTPAADLLARVVHVDPPEAGGTAHVAALVSAISEDALDHARHEIELAKPDARFVQPAVVAAAGADEVRRELLSRSGLALLGVLVYMAFRYRDTVKVLAASMPSLCAAAGTLGVCALTDMPLTPASGPALVLVLGVAFDQGIFLVEADEVSPSAFAASRAGILLALATAFTGFAGLLVASHPAVHSIGFVVSVGIACTAVGAFGIVPAMLTIDGAIFASRQVRRALFTVVIVLQIDALIGMAGWIRPPTPPGGDKPIPTLDRALPLDRRVGDARLVRTHGLWVLHVGGDAYDIGRATAALGADLFGANETAMRGEFDRHVPNLLAQYLLSRGTPILAQWVAPLIPEPYLLELWGTEEGGADPLGWWSPIYTRKLCYHAIHDVGQAMVDSPLVACTGFAAGAERTPDGHWVLGRNFDFDGGRIFDEDKAVIAVERDGMIPFVHVAIVGMGGAVSGVNAAGIGVAVLAGASDARIRPGDPMIFIIREVLESARSLDDVQHILDQRRGFVSEGILAIDGEHGGAAVFEVTPDDVTRLPVGEDPRFGNAIALANHFRSAKHKNDAANHLRMVEGTSVARMGRMEELIDVARGPIDVTRALAILRDRRGVGDRVLPAGHEDAINADIASHGVYIDATARTLTVSTFPNLAGPFVRFSLDDLRAGRLDGELVSDPETPELTWHARQARTLTRLAATQAPADAETSLRHALSVNPGDIDATLALGLLLAGQGRDDEARTLLQAALDTPPERVSQARAARAALTRLERGP